MKTRPALIAAYGAAAIACIAIVAMLFKTWGPLTTPKRAPTSVNMAQALQTRLAKAGRDQAVELYQARGFSTVWFEGDQLSSDGRRVVALLAAAETEALPAASYRLPAMPGTGAGDEAKAEYDLALTTAALRYAADMRWGAWRPDRFFNDVSMTRERDDVAIGLVRAADSGNAAGYLQGLAPPEHDYGLLRAALARYRAIAASWPTVAAESRLSRQNMAALKARLQAEDYLPPDATAPSAITAALKAYQAGNGLTANGQLNERTVAMLNVPPAARAQQIAVNMERLRWMPHGLGAQYIMVNAPDASLVLMESGQQALVSRVVVGAPDKPTPILAAKAVAVTINPAWHVPKSIVTNEIQPKLDQDSGYLESKHMEMENGEVVQLPGPDNALGQVKFELPNVFNVYLHDTPSKHAFLSNDRAQSHGCVRVEQIKPLAEHVLGISDDELQQAIAGGKTEARPLQQPIPVYIQYFTAIARDNGQIGFRADIYGRDARMISIMFPGQPPTQLASSGREHTNR
ncbi:MAG TPA: L,D-transpeptidase family protein [Rhizomicrobium sp.]